MSKSSVINHKEKRINAISKKANVMMLCILSVVILVNFWNVLPFAATACFAFLSLRVDETSIIDYIFNAVKFFLTSQQLYLWRKF